MIFKKIGRAIFLIIEVCGALVGAAGIVLLYISWLAWLKTGTMPTYDLQMLWADLHPQPPHSEWIGELVLAGVMKFECWMVFLIIGGGLFILGSVGERLFDNSIWLAKKVT